MTMHILNSHNDGSADSTAEPLAEFPEIETAIIVKNSPLPVVYTFDQKSSLMAANIAVPANVVTSRFPWRELIENLACSILLTQPGYLEPGVFVVVRHYSDDGEADGLTFSRVVPGSRGTEGKVVGEWVMRKESASYTSLLTIFRPDGYPRLSVVSRFDSYGGVML